MTVEERDRPRREARRDIRYALSRGKALPRATVKGRPVEQHAIEAMLADRSRALGIEVRRGCGVTGFRQSAEGVVEIDDPEHLLPIGRHRTSGGVFAYGIFPGRLFMLDFIGPPENRDAPVTREEIEGVLRRISGADVRVKALESGGRWTANTRLVDTYRQGRVLLAGDAAHIHSPFGGQGMSLGLVDAANLGWKLASVIRGEMPESLLDTYSTERRPVAKAVLENTLAQAAIMRPDPQSVAMRDIIANLMQLDDVNRFISEMMSGLSSRYDLGSDRDEVGRLIGDRVIGHGDTDVSLYDVMQDGMGVLLDASVDGAPSIRVLRDRARTQCAAGQHTRRAVLKHLGQLAAT